VVSAAGATVPDSTATRDRGFAGARRRPLVAVTGRPIPAGRIKGWARDAVGIQRAYLEAVRRSDALAVMIDPIELDPVAARELVTSCDAIVLTGGPDVDPSLYGEEPNEAVYGTDIVTDRFEIALCRAAISTGVPLLAICRGIQVVNVALGGSLIQHLPEAPGLAAHGLPGIEGGEKAHDVSLAPESLLAKVLGVETARCSCHHHQAVARCGDRVSVTASAADGVVEGIEVEGVWLLAVQWHPEDTAGADPVQQRLFDALAERARVRASEAG